MFSYIKILKQAFGIVKTHKFLWIFGLFLVWGYLPNLTYLNRTKPQLTASQSMLLLIGVVIILVLLVMIYFRARAGLIAATKSIIDKQPLTFEKSWKLGRNTYLRMFQVSLLVQICLSIIFLLLAFPVVYLAAGDFTARALILGLIALIIFLPIWFMATMVNIAAEVFIGIFNLSLSAAIASALDLTLKFWRQLFGIAFSMFGITLIGTLLSVVPAGLISLLFVIFARLAYHNGSALPYNLNTVTLIVSSIVFFFVQAVISVYHQVAWVLTILELSKPQKVEEDKDLAQMPEIA